MEALTLEPIAAINVLIPPTMRRLNVALVDIGAGTSDIAITNNGTVVAYGMVPTAGDEITEALSDHYLLDFPIAETAKRQVNAESEISIKDILGFDQFIPKDEVLTVLAPAIHNLAEAIANEILRLNNNIAPKAIMLVGGGSLTPNLTYELGQILELPENRIAVRGIDAIQNLTREENIPASPELVTPIGIAIAAKKMPIQYISLTVNEQVVRLFELKEITVGDAFLAANVRAKQLYGKPGHGLSVQVNGQDIFIPGEHGKPAEIFVNGETATTKTVIKSGDAIQLEEGMDGQPATATVADLVDGAAVKTVTIQNQLYRIEPKVYVNGQLATLNTSLHDNDKITFDAIETVEDILEHTNQQELIALFKPYCVYVDGKPVILQQYSSNLYLNDKPCKPHYPVNNGDIITFQQSTLPTVEMLAAEMNLLLEDKIRVTFQGESLELVKTAREVLVNGAIANTYASVPNGATISTIEKDKNQWIFQDVFRFSNWQLPVHFVGQFEILRNGEVSSFDATIFGGDVLAIKLNETSDIH